MPSARPPRKALEALGIHALASLRKATLLGDLELRRRAQALIGSIENRAETAEILKPTMIQLKFKDTPIVEAVRDLNRQYPARPGFSDAIVVWGVDKKRTITLTTPSMSFWEALDEFCQAAELTHVLGASVFESSLTYSTQPLGPAHAIQHHQVVLVDNQHVIRSANLRKARSLSASTCYAGVVRIRAFPRLSQPTEAGRANLTLEFLPEPKFLGWYEQSEMNLTVLYDAKSNALARTLALEDVPDSQFHDYVSAPDLRRGAGLRLIELALQLPNRECQTVRSLKGTLAVRVESAEYPVLMVEDVQRARDATFQLKDGVKVTVEKIKRLNDGSVTVGLSLPAWSTSSRWISDSRLKITVDRAAFALELFDANGLAFTPANIPSWGSREIRATFQPKRNGALPGKIAVRGSHVTTIEIPFSFNDLRLR